MMEFLLANKEDSELVYQMMVRAKEDSQRHGIYQWDDRYPTRKMLDSDIENGFTELIRSDGRIIGFFTSNSICEDDVHNHIQWLNESDNWIILHRLCVDPAFQNRGLGKQIVQLFEHRATQMNYLSIRIDVFGTNEKAIHIYESAGFTRVGQAMCERGLFYIYEKLINQ